MISLIAGLLGCYADSTPSDLTGPTFYDPHLTQSICTSFCKGRVSADIFYGCFGVIVYDVKTLNIALYRDGALLCRETISTPASKLEPVSAEIYLANTDRVPAVLPPALDSPAPSVVVRMPTQLSHSEVQCSTIIQCSMVLQLFYGSTIFFCSYNVLYCCVVLCCLKFKLKPMFKFD